MKRPKVNISNFIMTLAFMISVIIQGVRLFKIDYVALSGPIFNELLWVGCLVLFVFSLVLVIYYVPLFLIIKITLSFDLTRFKVNFQYIINKPITTYHYVLNKRDIYLVKQVFRC